MFLIWGEGRGVSRDPTGGCFAHPLGGVACRGHAQYPAFAPNTLFLLLALQKWQLSFVFCFVFSLLYLLVQNFPQLPAHS